MVAEVGEAHVIALQAPGNEFFDRLAAKFFAENDDERFFSEDRLAEFGSAGVKRGGELAVVAGTEVARGFGLARELDGPRIGDVKPGAIEAHAGAEEPGQERMLVRRIAANKQDRAALGNVAQACGFAGVACECARERRVIRSPLVVDIVGAKNRPRKLLQQVVLFVRGAVGADDAYRRTAARVANLLQLSSGNANGMLPCGGLELALRISDERLRKPVGALDEVESEAALGAKEIAVDAALVAIVGANDLGAVVGLAHAERDFAAVGAVGANGGNVVHLPGAGFVAIAAAGERAHRADVDAHAALLAVELVAPNVFPSMFGTITESAPRLWMPSAHTSMPSPHMRMQR